MKKRLESELISIAHRILKLKNKSEVDQLYKETQKLYETLSVLKFYHDNFEAVKGDLSLSDLEEKIEHQAEMELVPETITEVKEEVSELAVVEEIEEETEENEIDLEEVEETVETTTAAATVEEESEEELAFIPVFELEDDDDTEDNEEQEEESLLNKDVKPEIKQISFEELLGENYAEPIFVKPSEVSLFSNETSESEQTKLLDVVPETKQTTQNNAFSKSIEVGLNDRIAFVNFLFNYSTEDFNRVISQLNTFDTFDEAKNFINEMVLPDYNYWVGKEEYLERFMEVVEKKFQ